MSFFVLLNLFVIGNSVLYEHSKMPYERANGPIWERVIVPQINNVQKLFAFGQQGVRIANMSIIRSLAGIAVFDYDNDGDEDIFVSNGRGQPHSLFENLFEIYGVAQFTDRGIVLGFGDSIAVDQDGSGVCFADINNDGYSDLLVLGRHDKNLMYLNQGGRKFKYLANNGIDNDKNYGSVGCSFGDIDNDGLVDVVIANSHDDLDNWLTIRESGSLEFYQPNELFRNKNGRKFKDISERIVNTKFGDPGESHPNDGMNTLSWGIIMADFNDDGYQDIIHVDDALARDQTAINRQNGIIHVFLNDGTGHFADLPTRQVGGFMGIEAADLNCDRKMDIFVSNEGAYQMAFKRLNVSGGSMFAFGEGDGTFRDVAHQFDTFKTPFGWGCAVLDFDNDGDLDVIMHGGLDLTFFKISDNPGVMYENLDGCMGDWNVFAEGVFELDENCNAPKCGVHHQRDVHGVAIGDLNNDGFVDILTSATMNFDLEIVQPIHFNNIIPFPPIGIVEPMALDETALFFFGYFTFPLPPGGAGPSPADGWYNWTGPKPLEGDLRLDMAIPNNNKFFHVTVKGSKGVLPKGDVNRDCIGCILTFIPRANQQQSASIPIAGGSSHISQHSLRKIFGLKGRNKGDILEIKYPKQNGGYVTNVLLDVRAREMLTLWEIPCDFNNQGPNYCQCVKRNLRKLKNKNKINGNLRDRLKDSMGCGSPHSAVADFLGLDQNLNLSDTSRTSIILTFVAIISVLLNVFGCAYYLVKSFFFKRKRKHKYGVVNTISSSSDEELSD